MFEAAVIVVFALIVPLVTCSEFTPLPVATLFVRPATAPTWTRWMA